MMMMMMIVVVLYTAGFVFMAARASISSSSSSKAVLVRLDVDGDERTGVKPALLYFIIRCLAIQSPISDDT